MERSLASSGHVDKHAGIFWLQNFLKVGFFGIILNHPEKRGWSELAMLKAECRQMPEIKRKLQKQCWKVLTLFLQCLFLFLSISLHFLYSAFRIAKSAQPLPENNRTVQMNHFLSFEAADGPGPLPDGVMVSDLVEVPGCTCGTKEVAMMTMER